MLNFFGNQFLEGFREPDKALAYFELMADEYPGAWAAWNGMGDAYYAKGDRIKATRMYEKSLTLNPTNDNARKKLKLLQVQ